MKTEKARSAQSTGWYLMTGGGDLIARVQSGTLLGEDPTGELSFRNEEALIEFHVGADGRLSLSSVSPDYDLHATDSGEARSACVDADSRAQIHFPHHMLLVDTDFVAPVPSRYTLQIAVVPVAPVADDPLEPELIADKVADDERELERVLSTFVVVGGSETPRAEPEHRGPRIEPTIGPFAERLPSADEESTPEPGGERERESSVERGPESNNEGEPESGSEPGVEPRSEPETRTEVGGSLRASLGRLLTRPAGIVLAVVIAFLLFLYEAQFASRPSPPPTQAAAPLPEPASRPNAPAPTAANDERVALTDDPDTAQQLTTPATGDADERSGSAAALAGVSSATVETGSQEAVEPAGGDLEPDAGPSASAPRENVQLLLGVTALLEAQRLPDRPTIDLAMQSLKALLVAYPDDPDVRRMLERLTERLVDEARLRFQEGDLIMAGRLIEQASGSGVAEDAVSDAMAEFSAPRADGASPREAPEAVVALPSEQDAGDLPDAIVPAAATPGSVEGSESSGTTETTAATEEPTVAPAEVGRNGTAAATEVSDASRTRAERAEEADAVAAAAALSAGSTVASGMVTDSIGSESTAAEEAVESAAGGTEPVAESSDTTATDDDVEEIDLAATSEAEPLDFTAPAPAAGDAGAAGAATDTGAQPVAASPGFPPPALEVTLEVRSRLEPEPGGASLAETASLPSLLTTLADQMEPPLPQGRTPSGSPAAAAPEPPPGMLDPETGDYEGLYPLSDLRVIEQKPPEYPPGVVPGTRASVDLELTVNPGGEVRDVRVVGKAGRIFEREALRAVYQWRFEPVRFAGERVAVRTAVRLTFRD